jgi:integrase
VADLLTDEYLAWCRNQRITPNTVTSRRRVLKSLGNAGVATREEVEAWWNERAHLTAGTRSNDLANLRTFFKWCRRWEHRDDDPTLRLDSPKVSRGLPRPLSKPDLLRLLDVLGPDLRRSVCLGAYAGLRVSEAAALRWDDIDLEINTMRINDSKGGKSRLVKVSPLLIDELLPRADGNVVTAGERPYSAANLQRKINRAIKAAGVTATFHQLRHRYGTVAYQATGDLLAVGRQMGHSSPVTTAIYAQASDDITAKIAAAVLR